MYFSQGIKKVMCCNQILKLSVLFIILAFTCSYISGKTCTSIKKKDRIIHKQEHNPCQVSYKARCHMFSLSYCTFQKPGYCLEQYNETVTLYYRVSECCKGYLRVQNGSCLLIEKLDPIVVDKLLQDAKEMTTEDPVYSILDNNGNYIEGTRSAQVHKKELETKNEPVLTLSHGTYAGIACALLFIISIAVLTGIRIRKRQKLNLQKKSPRTSDQIAESAVLYDPNRPDETTAESTEPNPHKDVEQAAESVVLYDPNRQNEPSAEGTDPKTDT